MRCKGVESHSLGFVPRNAAPTIPVAPTRETWSAVHQHIRQVRVRGRVLQQCQPPPALSRLAEALLPVQPLPLLEQR